jgi:hypothetical protein
VASRRSGYKAVEEPGKDLIRVQINEDWIDQLLGKQDRV